ncbi:MAG: acetyl-CoA carboxylase biotin carboxyl carrier protein [Streptomycetales bacterium]
MELTHHEVLEILEILERSNVEYLELEVGETKLVADRRGGGPAWRKVREDRAAPATPSDRDTDSQTAPSPDGDLVTVSAPVVGVFYRSPEPGAPPLTEVGAQVSEDSTLGLVEVMKMFNSVTAGVRGEVVEILVRNEEFVEFGQPLMRIRPETAG